MCRKNETQEWSKLGLKVHATDVKAHIQRLTSFPGNRISYKEMDSRVIIIESEDLSAILEETAKTTLQ